MTGEVYQVWKKEILVMDDDGNDVDFDQNQSKYHLISLRKENL